MAFLPLWDGAVGMVAVVRILKDELLGGGPQSNFYYGYYY